MDGLLCPVHCLVVYRRARGYWVLSCRPLGGVLGECPRRREEVHLLQSCGPLGNAGGEHCSHAWLAAVSGLPCDREEGRWLQSCGPLSGLPGEAPVVGSGFTSQWHGGSTGCGRLGQ